MSDPGQTLLDELGIKHGTDKASTYHDYLNIYAGLIPDGEPINLLEIGWDKGASMRMWREYFVHPDARIVGVDIEPKEPIPGVEFWHVDATTPAIAAHATEGPLFDVIIDDGSHLSPHIRTTMTHLWPYLADGGLYIVEDLHVSYHPDWLGKDSHLEPGPHGATSMQFLRHLTDDVHYQHAEAGPAIRMFEVASIEFHPGLCIIRKGQTS